MKALALLPLLIGSLLAWEPIPKMDNNTSFLQELSPDLFLFLKASLSYGADDLHYSDKLLYFLDGRSFEILGKLYILNNQETHYKDRFVYQNLSTDTYYIAQGNPITEENPFGWKEIEKPNSFHKFLGYMLFIDFPKDPKSYRAYSWILVNPNLKSFKKLIGADPKGGFRWYVDEGWEKRVVIEKKSDTITFKTRGISAPLLPEQEGYYFGYQPFSGKWVAAGIEIKHTLSHQTFAYKNKLYPVFYSKEFYTDFGSCLDYYYIIIGNKRYSLEVNTNKLKGRGAPLLGYIDGCLVFGFPGTEDVYLQCKVDNAIGESPVQKDPYRGEIITDTSKLPKPTSNYKKCR